MSKDPYIKLRKEFIELFNMATGTIIEDEKRHRSLQLRAKEIIAEVVAIRTTREEQRKKSKQDFDQLIEAVSNIGQTDKKEATPMPDEHRDVYAHNSVAEAIRELMREPDKVAMMAVKELCRFEANRQGLIGDGYSMHLTTNRIVKRGGGQTS